MTLYKTSNAVIAPQAANYPVWILEVINPEDYLVSILQRFMQEIEFKAAYPNFGNVRIGAVHPFALLLFQEVLGQPFDMSVFPSITVADNSEAETAMTLGRDRVQFMLTQSDVADLEGYRVITIDNMKTGQLSITNTGLARMKAAVLQNNLLAEQAFYSAQHTVNINIWADNRDVTNAIYDMVIEFLNFSRVELHQAGVDVLEAITGNRTGDINMDFGALLYGSNIELHCIIRGGAMRVTIPKVDAIEHIDVSPPLNVNSEGHFRIKE